MLQQKRALQKESVYFGIPTNNDTKVHAKQEHGVDSWRFKAVAFLHSEKIEKLGLGLLMLDVFLLFIELFLLASFVSQHQWLEQYATRTIVGVHNSPGVFAHRNSHIAPWWRETPYLAVRSEITRPTPTSIDGSPQQTTIRFVPPRTNPSAQQRVMITSGIRSTPRKSPSSFVPWGFFRCSLLN